MSIKRTIYPAIMLLSLFTCAITCGSPAAPPAVATATATPTPLTRWTTYTEADGLPGNHVTSLAFAPDGALWVGTWSGLTRLDGPPRRGETWPTYVTDDGIPDNDGVRALAVAPDGTLWASTTGRGTSYGISRFDGAAAPVTGGGTWTTYSVLDGLAHPHVKAIAVAPDGTIWAGTWGGLSRFDGATWTTYTEEDGLPNDHVNAVAVDPDGTVWIGTEAGGARFDGQMWTTYTFSDDPFENDVWSIAATPDGAVWFGTYEGLSRFDGKAWTTYPEIDRVSSIAAAPDGTLWIGTVAYYGRHHIWPDTGGIYCLEGAPDGAWTVYRTDDGLADNTVLAVAVAPDGTVWAGTIGGLSSCHPHLLPKPAGR